jgi:hypothetical protein
VSLSLAVNVTDTTRAEIWQAPDGSDSLTQQPATVSPQDPEIAMQITDDYSVTSAPDRMVTKDSEGPAILAISDGAKNRQGQSDGVIATRIRRALNRLRSQSRTRESPIQAV